MSQRYQRWLTGSHRASADGYEDHLRAARLARVVPLPELLRTGRRWRECGTVEFTVPPREDWAAMEPTLRLVAELEATGILRNARVASAWRNPAFNRCEGGSEHSRHLVNNALDFDIDGKGISVELLCAYWNKHGAARRRLGFYSSDRIHVDTSGFRTWGHDHQRASSLCTRNAPPMDATAGLR